MSEPHPTAVPPQLAKFSPEVKAAYARYVSDADPAAVQTIVLAALADFMPKRTLEVVTTPSDEQRLIEDLGYDSLAVAETVFFLEDLFNVKIGNRDLLDLRTVGELRNFVVVKLTESKTAGAQ
jgi:acyl carrier protein